MTDGHQLALAQLRRVASAPNPVLVIDEGNIRTDKGWLLVDIALDCDDVFPLESPERATLYIPPDFPFSRPAVVLPHVRFARLPHVMWARHLCLYQARSDWDPNDGMPGFIERLALWYLRAATGSLAETGQPLHPPLAYPSREAGHVVVRADLPPLDGHRLQVATAVLVQRAPDRVDVVDWLDMNDPDGAWAQRLAPRLDRARALGPAFVAPLIALPDPLTFEFPDTVADLVPVFARYGLTLDMFVRRLGAMAAVNGGVHPVFAFIGAPMRGIAGSSERLTHLAAWRLAEADARLTSLLGPVLDGWFGDHEKLVDAAAGALDEWVATAPLTWALVHEQRPQIVTRRDTGRPASWLMGRRVVVLGCGALGARVAEHCVRAGIAELTLVDRGAVMPGVLVRQPYVDAEIGRAKAAVLAEHLLAVNPEAVVNPVIGDAVRTLLRDGVPDADLIVDATADRSVAARLEWLRGTTASASPPILSLGVGHTCERGLATLALPDATGAGVDLLYRLTVDAFADAGMSDVTADFFPRDGERDVFQPEPGCSEPTYLGSDTEAAALTGQLIGWALDQLHARAQGRDMAPMSACVARLPSACPGAPGFLRFDWPADHVMADAVSGYQIRLRREVLEAVRAEARGTAHVLGHGVETGGVLLGRIDDACRTVWITTALGPPADSLQTANAFRHGVAGVEERIARARDTSGDRVRFVGMWHTHPAMRAAPSATDREAMKTLLLPIRRAPSRAVIVIFGGAPPIWDGWLNGTCDPKIYSRLVDRVEPWTDPEPIALSLG